MKTWGLRGTRGGLNPQPPTNRALDISEKERKKDLVIFYRKSGICHLLGENFWNRCFSTGNFYQWKVQWKVDRIIYYYRIR